MTAKLVRLDPPTPKPDEDVVRLCRMLLQWAEAGEIRSIIVAADTTDDKPTTGLAFANGANVVTLAGILEIARTRLLARITEE